MALSTLVVTSLFPNNVQPTWGVFNARSIEHLARVADVRVIAPVKWFPGLSLISKGERELGRIPAASTHRGIEVTHPRVFRSPGVGRWLHDKFYEVSIRDHVQRLTDKRRPDVILAAWAHPDGCAMQQLGDQLGIPVVVKCLGTDVNGLLQEPRRGERVLASLRRSARVITVSERLRQVLISRGIPEKKIDVIYHGVDRGIFRPRPQQEVRATLDLPTHNKFIVCVAELVPIKRHVDLIDAFSILRSRFGHDVSLVLVGDGPLRAAIAQQVVARGLEGHVWMAGCYPHPLIAQWMAASDLVCLASDNEGLPNVLVEALACGRPVVATDVGGVSELVSSIDHGRLVPRRRPAELAQAMHEVLSRSWDPTRLSACPQVISWEQSTERLVESLARAAGRNPPTGPADTRASRSAELEAHV